MRIKIANERHAAQRKILSAYPDKAAQYGRELCPDCVYGQQPEILCHRDLIPVENGGKRCSYYTGTGPVPELAV